MLYPAASGPCSLVFGRVVVRLSTAPTIAAVRVLQSRSRRRLAEKYDDLSPRTTRSTRFSARGKSVAIRS
jgi:hypothetical protein